MRLYLLFLLLVQGCGLVVGKFDDFDDTDDIVEYDDNDFAEFEDANEDAAEEVLQKVTTVQDDEEEATVELEDQEDFEDPDIVGVSVLPHSNQLIAVSPAVETSVIGGGLGAVL